VRRAGTGLARPAAAAVALLAALLFQLTIVNGVPLPGGGTPDLVLLTVIAIGLVSGPRAGLATGFLAGLALDVAPPASNLAGQYALVFCMAGYASVRMRGSLRRSALLAIGCAMVVAAAAEAMAAGLTVALDSPEVSLATVAQVLPATLAYDLALTPLLLFAVVRLAAKLGAGVDADVIAPAGEPGGSAVPAATGRPGIWVPVPAGGGSRHRAGGGTVAPGDPGRPWVVGDRTAGGAQVGSVGWLSRPATSRRARRKQAKLTASLTGAKPRKGDISVAARPGRLFTASAPTGASSRRRARLRPWAGVPGSAASAALLGQPRGRSGARPASIARPIHIGRPDDAQRHKRRSSRDGPWGSRDWHGTDRHAVFGPSVPRISFGSNDAGPARPRHDAPRVPRISFGSNGTRPAHVRPAAPSVPRISFGSNGTRPAHVRPAAPSVPRISFGSNGSGTAHVRHAAPSAPRISFGSNGAGPAHVRPAGPQVPRISFGSNGARPAHVQHGAGSVRLRHGAFAHAPSASTPRVRRPEPKISFRTQAWPGAMVTNPRRPAEPRFAASASAARAARSVRQHRAQPHFTRGPQTLAGSRPRTRKTARMGAGRRLRWLRWARVRGGRSAVWRIGGTRTGRSR